MAYFSDNDLGEIGIGSTHWLLSRQFILAHGERCCQWVVSGL